MAILAFSMKPSQLYCNISTWMAILTSSNNQISPHNNCTIRFSLSHFANSVSRAVSLSSFALSRAPSISSLVLDASARVLDLHMPSFFNIFRGFNLDGILPASASLESTRKTLQRLRWRRRFLLGIRISLRSRSPLPRWPLNSPPRPIQYPHFQLLECQTFQVRPPDDQALS